MSEIERYLANRDMLIEANAYNPLDEHDACGVGLVASLDGKPRREIVEMGIKAPSLATMSHPKCVLFNPRH